MKRQCNYRLGEETIQAIKEGAKAAGVSQSEYLEGLVGAKWGGNPIQSIGNELVGESNPLVVANGNPVGANCQSNPIQANPIPIQSVDGEALIESNRSESHETNPQSNPHGQSNPIEDKGNEVAIRAGTREERMAIALRALTVRMAPGSLRSEAGGGDFEVSLEGEAHGVRARGKRYYLVYLGAGGTESTLRALSLPEVERLRAMARAGA